MFGTESLGSLFLRNPPHSPVSLGDCPRPPQPPQGSPKQQSQKPDLSPDGLRGLAEKSYLDSRSGLCYQLTHNRTLYKETYEAMIVTLLVLLCPM